MEQYIRFKECEVTRDLKAQITTVRSPMGFVFELPVSISREDELVAVVNAINEAYRVGTISGQIVSDIEGEVVTSGYSGMPASICATCDELKSFLLDKNKSYGNSAADPVRIFSASDPLEQINVRIDDKLSRIANGNEFDGDDTELDLIGYLILKRAIKRATVVAK